ncbi:MAG: beta-ketoacyl-ACP synthase II [Candidatus Sumerlaeia bacterium]
MYTEKRVVVTGLGAVTPIGNDVPSFWDSLLAGRSGVAPITLFDTEGFEVNFAAEVKGWDGEALFGKKEVRRIDRFVQFALKAAAEAIKHAGIEKDKEDPWRCGVYIGAGIGGIATIEEQEGILVNKGPNRVSPLVIPKLIPNMAAGVVSIEHNFKGPNLCHVSACATGAHAIGEAVHTILRGDADVMIAGGSEAAVSPLAVAGFQNMGALSKRSDAPQKASRPFEKSRDGFVMGEGAGVLVLESLEHARARGANILAEISGYGLTGDAYHFTAPAPEGEGCARAMMAAIRQAGLSPESVNYINAHGTSTPLNDVNETQAIKRVFGDHARNLCVSSNKSMIGHLLGAAGSVEMVATVLSVVNDLVPPTINYEEPDPDCDLDYVPNTAREWKVNVAISNNMGFGGHNCSILIRKFV